MEPESRISIFFPTNGKVALTALIEANYSNLYVLEKVYRAEGPMPHKDVRSEGQPIGSNAFKSDVRLVIIWSDKGVSR